jgi:hypothetical protein
VWIILGLASAVAALLSRAIAEAKIGCESRGISRDGIALRGLPPRPVVGCTYSLTVALPDSGVNAVPYLGAESCGELIGEAVAGASAWFRKASSQPSTFVMHLRFSHPGPWAVSFMDLDGTFHDLGLHRVTPAPARDTDPSARMRQTPTPIRETAAGITATADAPGSDGRPAPIWIALGAASLAIGTSLFVVSRLRRLG